MKGLGKTDLNGGLGLRVVRGNGAVSGTITPERPGRELSLKEISHFSTPQGGLTEYVNAWRKSNLPFVGRGVRKRVPARYAAKKLHLPYMWSQLWLKVLRADGREFDLGLVGVNLVTDAGVNFIVDAFQNITEIELLKFHGIGTGSTAEAVGDTALVTELTTQYTTDNTRATGTTVEGASPNIYRTVGTNPVDATVALREHGILDQAATGGGTLLDRTVFALINLDSGDSLESTYELTVNSGG